MPVQHADFGMGCTLLQCSPKMTQPSTLCGTLKSASAFEMNNNNNNKWQWLCIRKQPTGWLTSRDRTGPVLGSEPGRSKPGLDRSRFFWTGTSPILALFMHVNKNDDDVGRQAGDCATVYTYASCQGCNDIHVSLKCVALTRTQAVISCPVNCCQTN